MELKKGMKLYKLAYHNLDFGRSDREMNHIVINKVNPKTIKASWYEKRFIRISRIGKDWFLTKQEAVENTLDLHLKEFDKNKSKKGFLKDEYIKEIKSLKVWLKRLKNKAEQK